MNHPFILLWTSVFIVSTLFHSVSEDFDHTQYTKCSDSFSCGVVSNVVFASWGYNREDYCDVPDFNSMTYRIPDFNFNKQTLTVAKDGTSFGYAGGHQNLDLPNHCITAFNPSCLFGRTSCLNGYTKSLDIGNQSSSTNFYAASSLESRGGGLGIALNWSDVENDGECRSCIVKGGEYCGYSKSKYTCFCNNRPCPGPSSEGRKLIIAIGASAGTVGMITILLILIICNRKRCFQSRKMKILKAKGRLNDHQIEMFMETYGTLVPRRYTYSEVKRMTKSFTTKIGEGGYGIVYKAIMPDARMVAVKVISETKGDGEEFINEVASISRTSHINIVSLLGFCYEKNKRALIYEFMPNGSLDKFIFKPNSSTKFCSLEWLKMHQISIGIARGLEYLHRGCNTRILHLDIKPQNILLDEEFTPKISDFGLAKICQRKESIVSILGTRGTIGYIAPEVFSRTYGGVSYKSDVYSYGMLVLEMIGARKNNENAGSHNSEMYFPDWIYKELEHSNDVVTGNVSMNEEEKEVVRKMTLVSLWCIQTNPTDRPPMNKVVEMLEGSIESLSIPPKPLLQSPPRAPLQLLDESYSSSMLD